MIGRVVKVPVSIQPLCHSSGGPSVGRDLQQARQGEGPTVFDWLLGIIELHCEGGREHEDGVELVLA